MSRLSIYLPPFAADYSGICSALFEFNSLVAINDAHCCTMNYTEYDEPRWSTTRKTTLCTKLRSIGAVFGNDKQVVDKMCAAIGDLQPDFAAVLGSPVPAIVGMDMEGIACEIESRSKATCFGFPSTGFSTYEKGVAAASLALVEHYALESPTCDARGVNVLGLTPLDFSPEEGRAISHLLNQAGWRVCASLFLGIDLRCLGSVGGAAVNLVVSTSGLPLARYLRKRFGTPFVVACPMGIRHGDHVMRLLEQTVADGTCRYDAAGVKNDGESPTQFDSCANLVGKDEICDQDEKTPTCETDGKRDRTEPFGMNDRARGSTDEDTLLIVWDAVMANSLRVALVLAGEKRSIDIASFFSMDIRANGEGFCNCYSIPSEKDFSRLISEKSYVAIVGDPLLQKVPSTNGSGFFSLPHPAVSSRLFWKEVAICADESFDARIEGIVRSR